MVAGPTGDTKLILEDIKLLKPSVFISVPRLLNRVYDAVNKRVCAFAPCASAIDCGIEPNKGHT
jgi:long-subunit acyl-CoA synthetase (AMP-forming)